jgi:beta-lactamase class A
MPVPDGTPRVAVLLADADGRPLVAHRSEEPFYAASTIKLAVLLAALRAVEAGTLDLEAEHPATRTSRGVDGAEFTLEGDHLDAHFPADGSPLPLRELLRVMIVRSSNEATNMVEDLVGLDAVAEAAAAAGCAATRVERRIGDASAIARGLDLRTSASDLVRLVRTCVRGAGTAGGEPVIGPASRALATAFLRAQEIAPIGAALRDQRGDGPVWGSKSGWIDGIRHDVAFVGDPDSADLRFLCVLTAGYGVRQGDAVMAALVATLLPAPEPDPGEFGQDG